MDAGTRGQRDGGDPFRLEQHDIAHRAAVTSRYVSCSVPDEATIMNPAATRGKREEGGYDWRLVVDTAADDTSRVFIRRIVVKMFVAEEVIVDVTKQRGEWRGRNIGGRLVNCSLRKDR